MFKLAKNIKLTKNLTKFLPKAEYKNENKITKFPIQTNQIYTEFVHSCKPNKIVRFYSTNHNKKTYYVQTYMAIMLLTSGCSLYSLSLTFIVCIIYDIDVYDKKVDFFENLFTITCVLSLIWPVLFVVIPLYVYKHHGKLK